MASEPGDHRLNYGAELPDDLDHVAVLECVLERYCLSDVFGEAANHENGFVIYRDQQLGDLSRDRGRVSDLRQDIFVDAQSFSSSESSFSFVSCLLSRRFMFSSSFNK
jgi:hypothetical protein